MGGDEVGIGPWYGDERPEYVVSIKINNVVQDSQGISLEASWRVENKNREITYSGDFSDKVSAVPSESTKGNAELLVQNFSLLLARLSKEIVRRVYDL